jgi:hypothetical protein
MAKKPITHQSSWTPEQETILRNMFAAGNTTAEIAVFLGRTRASVYTRKYQLGLEGRISRSTKSQTQGSVRAWTQKKKGKSHTNVDTTPAPTPQMEIQFTPPVQTKRGRVKKSPEGVTPKLNSYNNYTYKLAFVNQRKQRGDVKLLAEVCEVHQSFVSRVLDGLFISPEIVDMAFTHCQGRPTHMETLQELGFSFGKKVK